MTHYNVFKVCFSVFFLQLTLSCIKMIAILIKEWRQYFSGPLGYLSIALFLLLTGLVLFILPDTSIFESGYATLDPFFQWAPYLMLLLVPALTMRSFSEEKRNGTFELLRSLPLGAWRLVVGKFLATLAVVFAALGFTLIYVVTIDQLSSAGIDSGAVLGSYIGLIFLCSVYASVGILCSLLMGNAISAFLTSSFVCYALYALFSSLADWGGWGAGAGYVVSLVGLKAHYDSISKGYVDGRDLIYFLSASTLFLAFTAARILEKLKSFFIIAFVSVLLVSVFHRIPVGIDLTAEKRFTLSSPTTDLIQRIDVPLSLVIYLEGELPAGFRRLAQSVEDIGNRFRSLSNGKFSIRFERPGEGLSDSLKAVLFDSLQQMGIHPTNVKAQQKRGEGTQESLVFPGAIMTRGERSVGIDFLEGQSNVNGLESLNTAEALLEFKLARSIIQLQRDTVPVVGYLTGNGEPLDVRVYDLIENVLRKGNLFNILPIDSVSAIPSAFDVLFIVKPRTAFTRAQRLKIDQYLMQGGKIVWAVDQLYASMDSLERSKGSFVAFDMGLDLDEQLFRYGVRINRDLIQDLECDKMPSVIGNMGGKPQIQLLPWPYAPLLRATAGHPISSNLDFVLSSFPQSIDTVNAPGTTKHILLSSSAYSRSLQTPALVEWNSIKTEEDLKLFNKGPLPVSVLLNGEFTSAFTNRITAEESAEWNASGMPFRSRSESTSLLVISDADVLVNGFSENDGPLGMGVNTYTRQQYANRDFITNALFFMTGGEKIIGSRSKVFGLRLLDREQVESDQSFWQALNLLLPLFLLFLLYGINRYWRIRKYTRS